MPSEATSLSDEYLTVSVFFGYYGFAFAVSPVCMPGVLTFVMPLLSLFTPPFVLVAGRHPCGFTDEVLHPPGHPSVYDRPERAHNARP